MHFTRLPLLDMTSIDFGVHFPSNTPFAVASLFWSVTHAHCLVHSVTLVEEFVFFRSLLLLTQKRHPINYSSSLVGLHSPLVILTSFLLDRASCRALVQRLVLVLAAL